MLLQAPARHLVLLLLALHLAVIASVADAILGYRTGSKALAWALLVVVVLALGQRLRTYAVRRLVPA